MWTNEGHSSCPGGMQAPREARPAVLQGETREGGQSVSPKHPALISATNRLCDVESVQISVSLFAPQGSGSIRPLRTFPALGSQDSVTSESTVG